MEPYFRIPARLEKALLRDAKKRDRVTARRFELLHILWLERYLTREELIARVEMKLGSGSFGENAWQETFYRDMRFVRSAFDQAGYRLRYSRSAGQTGYYLEGEGRIHDEVKKAIQGALDELDERQIEIYRRLTPAQKFSQSVSMIDISRRVSAYLQEERHAV
jgi:hypothetical protein